MLGLARSKFAAFRTSARFRRSRALFAELPRFLSAVDKWPEGAPGPTKFVLSTMPQQTSLKQMVRTFKSRWRIERSYEDLKGELGLDHYEGRTFVGWHHHVTVVLACYAFLVAEHARSFPPSARSDHGDDAVADAA
jgi:SRSO17 transposase